jgi:hypothetical protein
MTGNAVAIVPSDAMRTAISPSIARFAKSSKFKVSPGLRISLSKRHPRIGRCIPNCCTVPARATDLIADQTIAGCYPKLRNSVLEFIGATERRQSKIRVCEARPRLSGAVVAPLAISQFL